MHTYIDCRYARRSIEQIKCRRTGGRTYPVAVETCSWGLFADPCWDCSSSSSLIEIT